MTGEVDSSEHAYTSLLAHELRTPVTAVFAYLQLLDRDELFNDPVKLRQYLAVVRGRAADLVRLVSELTTFSDLVAGREISAESSPSATLPDVIQSVVGDRPVHLDISADAAAARVDGERVRLVLKELLANAFKFGPAGGPVLIRAELAEQPVPRLAVRVTNQGPEIPDEMREIIFAPFRQAEPPNTRNHPGLGLGLTVARHAAQGAGGDLILERGAPPTFRLVVPLREDPVAREARDLRVQAAQADAQALRAIQDMRFLRRLTAHERGSRERAEAQQLRAVEDFRSAHRAALDLAGRLDSAYFDTISALARAVEARDYYTGSHVERVRRHSLQIAAGRGLSDGTLRQLEFGAVLHDVGKLGVPDAILRKQGPLDAEEWIFMRHHPEIGRRILEGIGFLAEALDAVGYHHERWDGRGYPEGLAGDAIPLFGRIVAIADAYDAMIVDRPYRSGMPASAALAEIERGRGIQFDPDLAAACLADPPPAITSDSGSFAPE